MQFPVEIWHVSLSNPHHRTKTSLVLQSPYGYVAWAEVHLLAGYATSCLVRLTFTERTLILSVVAFGLFVIDVC